MAEAYKDDIVVDFNSYDYFVVFHDGMYVGEIIGSKTNPTEEDIKNLRGKIFEFGNMYKMSKEEIESLKASVVDKERGLKMIQKLLGPKSEDSIH